MQLEGVGRVEVGGFCRRTGGLDWYWWSPYSYQFLFLFSFSTDRDGFGGPVEENDHCYMESKLKRTEKDGCCCRIEGMRMALIAKKKFGSVDELIRQRMAEDPAYGV